MVERVVRVRVSRVCASRWPMMPSFSATTVLHRYAPMFVGDVYPDRDAADSSASMLSAGRPVLSSVIAANDAQVSVAQRWRSARSARVSEPVPGVGCCPPDAPATAGPARATRRQVVAAAARTVRSLISESLSSVTGARVHRALNAPRDASLRDDHHTRSGDPQPF